jgi:hypothetical protein
MFYNQASSSQKTCAIPPQEGKENHHPDHLRLYEMYLPFIFNVEVEEHRKKSEAGQCVMKPLPRLLVLGQN